MKNSRIDIDRAVELLRDARHIAVFTHENPDGDAIGSAAGMTAALNASGRKAELFLTAIPPESYRRFVGVAYRTELAPEELIGFDLILQLDTATEKRIAAPYGVKLDDTLPLLAVDHHPDNTEYGRWNLVAESAATSVIALEIAEKLVGTIPVEAATLFLLGIVTDSGGFRFDNTDPACLRAAAGLIELNADYRGIVDAVFFTRSLDRLKFEAELLSDCLDLRCGGKLAIVTIPPALIAKYHIDMSSTEGLVDVFRSIKGVETVAMLYYRNVGLLKVSLRARNPLRPVGPIARSFGGGGHEMAAGCLIENGDPIAVAKNITDLFEGNHK
ncbi:MAG: DHH family phosphoesterase [Victivallaceae bacterium]|nr:DHH family phosphoesterase [Victivallaceae bacterium]